ncbi:hypothetical protein GR254_16125 [Mycobacterium tuberculosis]|nr:hypothetical protein [Mycobacterium tuberculosis]
MSFVTTQPEALAFLVCGGTGAGKTTLLAAMLGAVSPDERIVCVEDAAELAPRHPHLVKLVARRANVEGIGEVTVRQLVRAVGLTALAGDEFGNGPRMPMVPGTWEQGSNEPEAPDGSGRGGGDGLPHDSK